jgi:hypothetical protein
MARVRPRWSLCANGASGSIARSENTDARLYTEDMMNILSLKAEGEEHTRSRGVPIHERLARRGDEEHAELAHEQDGQRDDGQHLQRPPQQLALLPRLRLFVCMLVPVLVVLVVMIRALAFLLRDERRDLRRLRRDHALDADRATLLVARARVRAVRLEPHAAHEVRPRLVLAHAVRVAARRAPEVRAPRAVRRAQPRLGERKERAEEERAVPRREHVRPADLQPAATAASSTHESA